jgi:DNA-binding NtrC family response regulator
MEHAYILAGGGKIRPEHVPHSVTSSEFRVLSPESKTDSHQTQHSELRTQGSARTLREIEMEHVLRVLEKHGGSKTKAADELGISLKTMYNKLNQLQEERKAAG